MKHAVSEYLYWSTSWIVGGEEHEATVSSIEGFYNLLGWVNTYHDGYRDERQDQSAIDQISNRSVALTVVALDSRHMCLESEESADQHALLYLYRRAL